MYVDITKQRRVTTVEWFHGYGGNALGLKRAIPGLCSVAVCERDAFVVANMVSKMEKGLLDAVPIWTDVTDFPTEPFLPCGRLDFFAASYPCQGFSHAGKRLGAEDHRHLWPYCRKFIQSVRPRFVWLENVEGHVSLGLSTVLADLEEDGYTAAWGIFSASEVGAPHQRKRAFILAYDMQSRTDRPGEDSALSDNGRASAQPNRLRPPEAVNAYGNRHSREPEELALRDGVGLPHGEPKEQPTERGEYAQRDTTASGGEDVAHHHHQRLQGLGAEYESISESASGHPVSDSGLAWPSRPGQPQFGWEPPRVAGDSKCDGFKKNRLIREGQQPGGVESKSSEDGSNPKTQPPLGRNPDGSSVGLDLPGLSGISDSELAEIYSWMVKGTNRTDELRMCGNGVVPQTAETAFRVLYAELRR